MSFTEGEQVDLSSFLSLPFFSLLSLLFTCSFQLIFLWMVLVSDREPFPPSPPFLQLVGYKEEELTGLK